MKYHLSNRDKHVSPSNQWRYSSQQNSNYFFSFIIKIKNLLENITRLKIVRMKNYDLQVDNKSYLISNNLKKKKFLLLSEVLHDFLKKIKIHCSKRKILRHIKKHEKIFYKNNPIENNSGGIGFNNSLFLYIFLKNIKIDMVIESGIWQGYTSYLIDQVCKNSKKIKFDINFDKIIYLSKKSEYCNYDIKYYNFENKKNILNKTAVFFDDHVSQLERFILSDNLNIPYVIFDDDINFETVHSDGWPAIPTISMIREKYFFKKIKWKNSGKIAQANFNLKFNKKNLNKYLFVTAPNISQITGYYIQSPMTFIVRKNFL